jgi:hypothetical protein
VRGKRNMKYEGGKGRREEQRKKCHFRQKLPQEIREDIGDENHRRVQKRGAKNGENGNDKIRFYTIILIKIIVYNV